MIANTGYTFNGTRKNTPESEFNSTTAAMEGQSQAVLPCNQSPKLRLGMMVICLT